MPGAAAAPELTVTRAAVLGAVQGPTELLPVSSSAHLSLVPKLAGFFLGMGPVLCFDVVGPISVPIIYRLPT